MALLCKKPPTKNNIKVLLKILGFSKFTKLNLIFFLKSEKLGFCTHGGKRENENQLVYSYKAIGVKDLVESSWVPFL